MKVKRGDIDKEILAHIYILYDDIFVARLKQPPGPIDNHKTHAAWIKWINSNYVSIKTILVDTTDTRNLSSQWRALMVVAI